MTITLTQQPEGRGAKMSGQRTSPYVFGSSPWSYTAVARFVSASRLDGAASRFSAGAHRLCYVALHWVSLLDMVLSRR